MSSNPRRLILVVDDDKPMRELICEQLDGKGLRAISASNVTSALRALEEHKPDVILTDIKMPGRDGLELCKIVASSYTHVPVIVMTAFGNMERAIEAMRAGAADFIPKPFKFDALEFSLKRALKVQELEAEVVTLREQAAQRSRLHGSSEAIERVRAQIERIAQVNVSVHVHGESGTGKELVARAIHDASPRAAKPFVALNCAALPPELLESELFGHTRGAFTGASSAREGIFRHAHGGTLLLDEVGDMPLPLQAKLLRVLEDSTIRPVGSDRSVDVDVRIISATHRDLREAAARGEFRHDLMYRLDAISIEVPPLRDRGEDISILAGLFIRELDEVMCFERRHTLSSSALDLLERYHWPGNVRELKNTLLAAMTMSPDSVISPEYIRVQQPSRAVAPSTLPEAPEALETLDEHCKRYILHVLGSVGGNKSKAARILGIDRKTLYTKLDSD